MRLVLDGETPSKKNSRIVLPNGKNIPGKKYREWHDKAMMQARAQFEKAGGAVFSVAVEVSLTFVHGDLRRRDCDNGTSSILDLLVDSGVLLDDNWQIVRRICVSNEYARGESFCVVDIKVLE